MRIPGQIDMQAPAGACLKVLMRQLDDMCVACIAIGRCTLTASILIRASLIWDPHAVWRSLSCSRCSGFVSCGHLWDRPR